MLFIHLAVARHKPGATQLADEVKLEERFPTVAKLLHTLLGHLVADAAKDLDE
jgi:hypothetical protein